jgi:hypothetical protein
LRIFMLAFALVAAFQAGRFMPTRAAWSPVRDTATVFAQTQQTPGGQQQTVPATPTTPQPAGAGQVPCPPGAPPPAPVGAPGSARTTGSLASLQAQEDVDALADRIASETLIQLQAQAPAVKEAVQGELATLRAAIQESLGPELVQMQCVAAASQTMLNETQPVLNRTDKTLNKTHHVLDETKDILNDTNDTLNETNQQLDEGEALAVQGQALMVQAQALAAQLTTDADDIKAIAESVSTIISKVPPCTSR